MTKRQQRRRQKQLRHRRDNDPMVQLLNEVEASREPLIVRVVSAMHRAVRVW